MEGGIISRASLTYYPLDVKQTSSAQPSNLSSIFHASCICRCNSKRGIYVVYYNSSKCEHFNIFMVNINLQRIYHHYNKDIKMNNWNKHFIFNYS